ncbi:MAG: calcium/sodium antiporter [Phycisphaerae bacterium]
MSLLLSFFLLALGLVLLIVGADRLVRGVSALAAAVGVSPLIIGLTVVAFGTSAPELVVNVLAGVRGKTDLAFSNIIGACVLNLGFVLPIVSFFHVVEVKRGIVRREVPMLLLACAAMIFLAGDQFFDNENHPDNFDHVDGVVLLLFFAVFLYYTINDALNPENRAKVVEEAKETIGGEVHPSVPKAVMMTIIGLVGIAAGGELSVRYAVAIAEAAGISQAVIGLTILSFGTTLPEMVTSVIAVRRGQSDIALGNLVGSCIFNLLFIGGVVSVVRVIPVPTEPVSGHLHLLFFAFLSLMLMPLILLGRRRLTRGEGAFLLAAWMAYYGYVIWAQTTA